MSLARWGANSDVYVYEDVDGGFVCEHGGTRFLGTARELHDHLRLHQVDGDRVPQGTFDELERRIGARA